VNTPTGRHRRRLAALTVAGLVLVAACGSSDKSSTTPPAAASSATTAAGSTAAPGSTSASAGTSGASTTAAASTTSGSPPVSGGTLTFAIGTDPISLNPRGGGAGNDALYVNRQIVDSLVEQDPSTGKLIPWLAQSWEVSADATTFTFHLRSGVTFSDGTPLTATIVKDNFDDIIASGAKANGALPAFTNYVSTTAPDDSTAVVTFSKPNAPFLQAASQSALGLLAPSTLAIPFDDRATGGLVGTGPFVLKSYTKNSEVILTKRTGYTWEPADRSNHGDAYVDELDFKIIPEAGVRTGSLQSGQVLAIGGVQPQDIATLRSAGYQLVNRANPGITFGLSPVVTHAPLDDVRVRQAISYAINRKDVRDTVLSPEFAVATSVLSQTTPGYVDLGDAVGYDADKAGQLLDAAGWVKGSDGTRSKDGKKLDLVVGWITNFGPNQSSLELIQAQLADAGITVTLQSATVPDYLDALSKDKYDITWSNLSRADGDVLRTSFSSAGTNYGKISDATLEQLLQSQLAAGDEAGRDKILADTQKTIVTQGYQIPVYELTTVLGLSKNVHGLTLGADSRLNQLTDAWVAK
jgi:peptide/nickel transport system substrate-binding protein